MLSMVNSGSKTNRCQFFITCPKCGWLSRKHIVIDGLLVM
ncbi:rCG23160 [Rattus norvegicus]|uniref:RCG23160 n=1 Tax=Rattus norvegicus TaxID=10116 RepID=A6KGA6_RAT|nr:rCG23160 [Rattus norvegicus]